MARGKKKKRNKGHKKAAWSLKVIYKFKRLCNVEPRYRKGSWDFSSVYKFSYFKLSKGHKSCAMYKQCATGRKAEGCLQDWTETVKILEYYLTQNLNP